jgi:hypothetical protein
MPRFDTKDDWILDSGCATHCTGTKTPFIKFTLKSYHGVPIGGIGGTSLQP